MLKTNNLDYNVSSPQGRDEYGAPSTAYVFNFTAKVNINILDQRVDVNNPLYDVITHIGITSCKDIIEGMKLSRDNITYNVEKVNNAGRFSQLYLKVV